MRYVLVLWLTFMNNGNAVQQGSIHSIKFENMASCEIALAEIKKNSRYVNGVCVRGF